MGEKKNAYRVLVCKPKVKKPLGRSRLRWKYYTNTSLKKLDGGAWTGLIWLKTRVSGWRV